MASRALAEPVDQDKDFLRYSTEPGIIRYSAGTSCLIRLHTASIRLPLTSRYGSMQFLSYSVINLTNLAIKRIIKMAKQVFAFSKLCQEDQVIQSKNINKQTIVLEPSTPGSPLKGWLY